MSPRALTCSVFGLSLLLTGCLNISNPFARNSAPAAEPVQTAAAAPANKAAPANPAVGPISGPYVCEFGERVDVARHVGSLELTRLGKKYTLTRDANPSGLPRFLDGSAARLVWIDLPWKGVLLDGKTQRPILSDCLPQVAQAAAPAAKPAR